MKLILTFKFLILMLTMSFFNIQNNTSQTSGKIILPADTIIGSRIITNEIAGGAYRKRAKAYFLIINNDTSHFYCICTESTEGEKVDMIMRRDQNNMTYGQRMAELRKIIPVAAEDFNLDSLKSINIGQLAANGDLAVDVTNEYRQKAGTGNGITKYSNISKFLKGSKLGTDFKKMFKPYSLTVDYISVEKVHFVSKSVLYRLSKIETDPAKVPDQILDCTTWVVLKKK